MFDEKIERLIVSGGIKAQENDESSANYYSSRETESERMSKMMPRVLCQ